ncbi:hypothetical protein BHAOGJBA_5146 [Methylobacterium hispanicum]|uniref:DUF4403 family protein n=1 Tax=Methylobacterium hispanicum TaxID=270350 RepID=A0AAV4ZTI3_9HYPH|nr:DUF4403 family protein [Methylobacterium hispanicum]GJD91598.1 hypothetical protein BHAOGJBA_5146 [Methylobacterium hispanicum]
MRLLRGSLILFVLSGAALYALSAFRTTSFQSQLPQTPPATPLQFMEPRISTIVIPVRVRLSALTELMERKAERSGTGVENDFAGRVLRDDRITYAWRRSDFSVAPDRGSLKIAADLAGEARAEGTFAILPLGVSAVVNGKASITVRPELLSNWRLKGNIGNFGVDLSRAEIDMGPTTVSVRTALSKIVRREVDRKINEANGKLADSTFLEDAMRREWPKLCRVVEVDKVQGVPPFFVAVDPVEILAAQPVISGDSIDLLVGVKARVSAGSQRGAPNCEFPRQISIVPSSPEGQFEIFLPIETSFDYINESLSGAVAGRTFTDEERGLSVKVRSLKIRPLGKALLVAADVTVRSSGLIGYVSGQASGTIYARAVPRIDGAKRLLVLDDVKLDVESQRPLTAVMGDAAAAVVERVLADKARLDIGREAGRIKERAAAAVDTLNRRNGSVKLEAKIDDIALEGVASDERNLRIIATAKGSAKTEVLVVTLSD